MNFKISTSMLAVAALMGTTSLVNAGGSSTFDAAVSVLSPDQTGFIIGGQVSVNGLGSGALTLSRSAAEMAVTGKASSLLDLVSPSSAYLDGVSSTSDISSSLTFDRNILTAGSLVGQGSVIARGEAIASMGTAGAATADTTTAGVRDDVPGTGNYPGGEGSASASASSQGSLNGSVSTANTLQLLGTSGLFAGSNSLDVGETNRALAYGSSLVNADGVTGINLGTAGYTAGTGIALLVGAGNGALFVVDSDLTSGSASDIVMAVSNAGNGTISLTTSTGGFFTGGGAAGGSATHVDNGSFFNPTVNP
jgi:hypothetical protein